MWLSSVSAVIDSGLGRDDESVEAFLARVRGCGESGNSVADEESPVSPSTSLSASLPSAGLWGDASRMVGRVSRSSYWEERTFCLMREGEKGVFLGGGGVRKSWTVSRIAVVISAREVYGKQMFRTALPLVRICGEKKKNSHSTYLLLCFVRATALSTTCRTSSRIISRWPKTRTQAP